MAELYDIGDRPRIIHTFYDDSDPPVLIDPTVLILELRRPNGVALPAEALGDAVQISLGIWSWTIPVPFDVHGRWWSRAEVTAPIQAAEELVLVVKKSKF